MILRALSHIYFTFQVHKFARDLEASFESLDALLCSNRNFSSEKLTTQMSEVFRMIQETLNQERHQGLAFSFSIELVL